MHFAIRGTTNVKKTVIYSLKSKYEILGDGNLFIFLKDNRKIDAIKIRFLYFFQNEIENFFESMFLNFN